MQNDNWRNPLHNENYKMKNDAVNSVACTLKTPTCEIPHRS